VAFTLTLPHPWAKQGWKVKIRDWERVEPPHVTLIRGTDSWRLGLREGRFLENNPAPRLVPPQLLKFVLEEQLDLLRREWDHRYPENPVQSEGNDDE